MGHQALIGAGASNPIDEAYEWITNTVGKTTSHVETEGLRGTREHISENVSEGLYDIGGEFSIHPNTAFLRKWLPRILGAAETGSDPYSYALAQTVPEFYFHSKKIGASYLYSGCKVNKATFRSSKGRPLNLSIELLGKTEASSAFPSLSLSTGQPFMHHHGAFTLASSSRPFDDVVLTIDNALVADRYFNSQTRTDLPSQDCLITLACVVPFTSTEVSDLYDKGVTALTGGSLVYTNGSEVLTFTLGAVQLPLQKPTFNGRGEILLPLNGTVRRVSTTPSIAAQIDLS
jgi:hypothetical protein